MIRRVGNTKTQNYIKIATITIIIVMILFIVSMIFFRYHVEGENNMPFQLSKISVISSSEGIDQKTTETKWAFDINQSNDIFIYIDKNGGYGKTEAIKTITIENIQLEGKTKDNINLYRPDEQEEKLIFKNKEENKIQTIEYVGSIESNLKQLKISNQGGIIAFRCSIEKLAEYKSNEEVINHHELLKKAGVSQEEITVKIDFDLKIKLESGKEYKTTIHLNLPIGNVIEEGTTSVEITDVKDFIFKRT
ncbi:MAG: hypothetical protein HFJ33_02570 [Clostridia bacterium]|nr:hypothetical protein [Clostridia bacterium]